MNDFCLTDLVGGRVVCSKVDLVVVGLAMIITLNGALNGALLSTLWSTSLGWWSTSLAALRSTSLAALRSTSLAALRSTSLALSSTLRKVSIVLRRDWTRAMSIASAGRNASATILGLVGHGLD